SSGGAAARPRERVHAAAAAVGALGPGRLDRAVELELVQRGIERALADLDRAARALLEPARQRIAVQLLLRERRGHGRAQRAARNDVAAHHTLARLARTPSTIITVHNSAAAVKADHGSWSVSRVSPRARIIAIQIRYGVLVTLTRYVAAAPMRGWRGRS